MGGHRYRCDACDIECSVYNSCGDRHCPLCAGAKRADWLTSTSELLLPGIKYFQVVFTIPDKLSSLALGNRNAIYDLLFRSSWQSLRDVIRDEQGFEAAAAMVLHTWNQKLESHAHVHALVPGGGPSLSGDRRWVRSRRPYVKTCDGNYLVDADTLRFEFRRTFVAGLKRLQANGELRLEGEWAPLNDAAAFDAWLKPLEEITWVAYIEAPPTPHSTPEHVVKYLARYLTGGPISDRRRDMAECPDLLEGAGFAATPVDSTASLSPAVSPNSDDPGGSVESDLRAPCCPACKAKMRCIAELHRPGWAIVMHSVYRPKSYTDG